MLEQRRAIRPRSSIERLLNPAATLAALSPPKPVPKPDPGPPNNPPAGFEPTPRIAEAPLAVLARPVVTPAAVLPTAV